MAALEAGDVSVQGGSASSNSVTHALARVSESKAAEPGAVNPNCFYSGAVIHCLHGAASRELWTHRQNVVLSFFRMVECPWSR